MTVAEIISEIGRIQNSINELEGYITKYDLKNGDWAAMNTAINCLRNYQIELENKIVK